MRKYEEKMAEKQRVVTQFSAIGEEESKGPNDSQKKFPKVDLLLTKGQLTAFMI